MNEIPTIGHWIDGGHRARTSARTAPVTDPATGQLSGQVELASPDDAPAAVSSAGTVGDGADEEADELVNTNPYGNGVALFTNDGGAARRFQNEVEAGMVGIDVPIPVHFFTRGKVVTTRWLDPSHAGNDLGFPQNR